MFETSLGFPSLAVHIIYSLLMGDRRCCLLQPIRSHPNKRLDVEYMVISRSRVIDLLPIILAFSGSLPRKVFIAKPETKQMATASCINISSYRGTGYELTFSQAYR